MPVTRSSGISSLIDKMKEEFNEKIKEATEKLNSEGAIADILPDELLPFADVSRYSRGLYGSIYTLTFEGDNRYCSYEERKPLPLSLLPIIAKLFPAMPRVQVEDGCIWHPTKRYWDTVGQHETRYKTAKVIDICSMVAIHQPEDLHGNSQELEWYSDVPGIGVVTIQARFNPDHGKNLVNGNWKLDNQYSYGNGGCSCPAEYSTAGAGVHKSVEDIKNSVGDVVGKFGRGIQWGRGSKNHRGHSTCYWVPTGIGMAHVDDSAAFPLDVIQQYLKSVKE